MSKVDGHLWPRGRAQVEPYVDHTLAKPLTDIYKTVGDDRVLWFIDSTVERGCFRALPLVRWKSWERVARVMDRRERERHNVLLS